jgi:hypothetical protein
VRLAGKVTIVTGGFSAEGAPLVIADVADAADAQLRCPPRALHRRNSGGRATGRNTISIYQNVVQKAARFDDVSARHRIQSA